MVGASAAWAVVAAAAVAAAALGLVLIHRDGLARRLFASVDPRPLALFRIGFGLALVGLVVETAPLTDYLLSDEGMFPSAAAAQIRGAPGLDPRGAAGPHGLGGPRGAAAWVSYLASGKWSLLHFIDTPWFARAYVAALAAAAVGLTIGWHTRTCAIAAWFLLAGLLRRGDAHYGGEQIFTGFTFLLMFADSGAAWSLDDRRRRRSGSAQAPRRVAAWPQALIVGQLVLAYAVNGWTKSGSTWVSGDTLRLSLELDRYARTDWHPLSAALGPWPFRLATWAVLWWERLFPLVLVGLWRATGEGTPPPSPRRRRATQVGWVVLALGLALAAMIPKALAEAGHDAVARSRSSALLVFALAIVVLAIAGERVARTPAIRLVDPRPWLVFGLLFHATSMIAFEIGAFVGATVSAYVLCGVGAWCVRAVHRGASIEPMSPAIEGTTSARAWFAACACVAVGGIASLTTGAVAPWHAAWLLAGVGLVARVWRRDTGANAHGGLWSLRGPGRVLAGGLIAYHTCALLLWQVPHWPSIPWRDRARAMAEPWMEVTYTRALWTMFAPNGPRRDQTVRTLVVDRGVVHDLHTEIEFGDRLDRPYLVHDRWRKVDEAVSGYRAWLAPWHARYVCRRWALDHDGIAPDEVVLERVSAGFAPYDVEDTRAWFWTHAEVEPIVRVVCAQEPSGVLDDEVRARHGLGPAAEPPAFEVSAAVD